MGRLIVYCLFSAFGEACHEREYELCLCRVGWFDGIVFAVYIFSKRGKYRGPRIPGEAPRVLDSIQVSAEEIFEERQTHSEIDRLSGNKKD